MDFPNLSPYVKHYFLIYKGLPIAQMLLHLNTTVTICHSKTLNIEREVS